MKASRLWREHRTAAVVLGALALVGVVLAADGGMHGGVLHRAFAVAVGVALIVPFAGALAFDARWLRLLRGLAISAVTLTLLAAAGELWIRLSDPAAFSIPELREDDVLGHAFVPEKGGYDAWGFRNARVPERADVVVLGDSQTYGTNVGPDDAYPAALARAAGVDVYNMGIQGYGPLQYVALLDRAFELEPRVVVVGFYFGNDVVDAFRFAGLEHWRAYRDAAMAYPDSPGEPIRDVQSAGEAPNLALAIVGAATSRSRLLWSAWYRLEASARASRTLAHLHWDDPGAPRFEDESIGTLFTPMYRHRALNLGRPRVRDGLRITEACLAEIVERCTAAGVEPALLLIHTKELYYHRLLTARGLGAAVALQDLARVETAVAERVIESCARIGLRVVDPTREVFEALADGRPLWPAYTDGHLSPDGCRLFAAVLAREIADWLE